MRKWIIAILMVGVMCICSLGYLSSQDEIDIVNTVDVFVRSFTGGEEPEPKGNETKETNIEINYKNKNMTIEFKDKKDGMIIGQTTLKSHKTYDEIRKVTTGKNRTVVWYEFSDFKDTQIDAIKGIEFIDMREEIANETYIKQFEKSLELMNESKTLVHNPNYLLPVEKNYTFVYKNGDKWLSYNSFDIPKETIIIGVQTSLFWGEFIDVRFNVLDNKLDRHAVVVGTNAGFVTEAPVDDLSGIGNTMDRYIRLVRDTSSATAESITEIGWWCDTATEEANFEVGLYAADGTDYGGEADTRLYAEQTNAKGTSAGWISVEVNWEIDPSTTYWIAVQLDDTTTTTITNLAFSGQTGVDGQFGVLTLPSPYTYGSNIDSDGSVAIYAVWEAPDSTPPIINCSFNVSIDSIYQNTVLNFSCNATDETELSTLNMSWNYTTGIVYSNYTVTTPASRDNVTTITDTAGNVINFTGYATDTSGNVKQNSTLITIQTTPPTDSCNPDSPLTADHSYIHNCNITADLDAAGYDIYVYEDICIYATISNAGRVIRHNARTLCWNKRCFT